MKDEDRFNRTWQSETITGTTTETSSCLLKRGSQIGKRLGCIETTPHQAIGRQQIIDDDSENN
jgi:hypothetical protein